MRFREFVKLQETGTSTGDIAGFSRICIPMVRRHWADWYGKRKGYRQPQVQEGRYDETGWLQGKQPTKMDYAKTLGGAALKMGIGAIPFVGAFAEVGEAALKIFQMRQAGKDVTQMITQMMNAKDQAPGMPANIFDLDDDLAATMSDPAKMEVAKQIMGKLDQWIQQVQSGQMPQEDANKLAVQYIQQKMQKAMQAKPAQQQNGQQQPQQGQQQPMQPNAPPLQTQMPGQQPQQMGGQMPQMGAQQQGTVQPMRKKMWKY